MGFFDFLPLGQSAPKQIPTFKQGAQRDPTDLQVRSLLYLFKRLRINRLASFSQQNKLKYIDGKQWDQSLPTHEDEISRLDKEFNMQKLKETLLEDEHRVLIDWPKNKFRALCFLSEQPANDRSKQSGSLNVSGSQQASVELPIFYDYKERPMVSFAFYVLPVNTSVYTRDLALELAQSFLYLEHHSYVSLATRVKIAAKAISKSSESEAIMIELTEDVKAKIVHQYLTELAFFVQLVRIYQQCIKPKEPEAPNGSPKKTLAELPRLRAAKSFLQLPNAAKSPLRPSLSPKKSMASFGSPVKLAAETSPVRLDLSPRKHLSARPSIPNFRANEIYNPVTSPPILASSSENKILGSENLLAYLSESGLENPEVWAKCKVSIREKLAQERAMIAKQSA